MKAHLKNIVVPVDFNQPSLDAIEYALDFAGHIRGKLNLVYVIETRGVIYDMMRKGDELVKITEKTKEKLEQLAEPYRKSHNIEIITHVLRGRIYKEILEFSDSIDARMVILGDNYPCISDDQTLGSTVYHVTLKSKAPVITVKCGNKQVGKKVVVPLDFTRQSRKQVLSSLAYGIHYDAEINLVSVKIADIKTQDSIIHGKLDKAHKSLNRNGVPATYKLYEYDRNIPPYKRVLEYAREIDADLILLLTHQEGFIHDNYIGAFAHHIINESPINVLSLTTKASDFSIKDVMKQIIDPFSYLFKPGL